MGDLVQRLERKVKDLDNGLYQEGSRTVTRVLLCDAADRIEALEAALREIGSGPDFLDSVRLARRALEEP